VTTRGNGPDRRPTKAERKEEARLERERIQRQIHRRRRQRSLGVGLVIGAAVIAVLVFFLLPNGSSSAGPIPSPSELLDRAADATAAAGCDPVETVGYFGGISDQGDPNYVDQSHIDPEGRFPTMPPLTEYPSIPPVSGPHLGTTQAAGIYDSPPELGQVLHSLEHGAAVVWYAPNAPEATVDAIKDFYAQSTDDVAAGQDRVLVAPYDYPDLGEGGTLPAGIQMALASWHHLQKCANLDLAVAFDYTSQYAFPTAGRDYLGDAPEQGYPI
jgi:hypothetical protein